MFLEVKGFQDVVVVNVATAANTDAQDVKLAFYWTDDDMFPSAEFTVDREAFENHVGGKVDSRDRFTINKKIRRNY